MSPRALEVLRPTTAIEVAAPGGPRSADVWVAPLPGQRLNVEIKGPVRLRRPAERLSATTAEEVVMSAWRKASTGAGGQLGPDNPGILLVGGFQLTAGDLDRLEAEAASLLGRKKRVHIMAIAIIAVGVLVERGSDLQRLQATLDLRVASNPHYLGPTPLSDHLGPGLRPIEGDVGEFTFREKPDLS